MEEAQRLFQSVQQENFRTFRCLLSRGADADCILPGGVSTFHIAVGIDNVKLSEEMTRLILESGANPNVRSADHVTPLHIAAAFGRCVNVQQLLCFGADPFLLDEDGADALVNAQKSGCQLCCSILQQYQRVRLPYTPALEVDDMQPRYGIIQPYSRASYGTCISTPSFLSKEVEEDSSVDYNITTDPSPSPPPSHTVSLHDSLEDLSELTNDLDVDLPVDPTADLESRTVSESDSTEDSQRMINELELGYLNSQLFTEDESDLCAGGVTHTERYAILSQQTSAHKSVNRNGLLHAGSAVNTEQFGRASGYCNVVSDDIDSTQKASSGCGHLLPDSVNCMQNSQPTPKCNSMSTDKSVPSVRTQSGEMATNYDPLALKRKSTPSKSVTSQSKTPESTPCTAVSFHTPPSNYHSPTHAMLDGSIVDELSVEFGRTFISSPLVNEVMPHYSPVAPPYQLKELSTIQELSEVTSCVLPTADTSTHMVETSYNGSSIQSIYTDDEDSFSLVETHWLPPDGTVRDDDALHARVAAMTAKKIKDSLMEYGEEMGLLTADSLPLYRKRLLQLMTNPSLAKCTAGGFSPELNRCLSGYQDSTRVQPLEREFDKQFCEPNNSWREGTKKHFFNYLLLDPQICRDLPNRHKQLGEKAAFQIFLDAIFYIGKGKESRPQAHFKEAVKPDKKLSAKVSKIRDIWEAGFGVVVLHVFHNVVAVKAYSCEACMIQAIGLGQLTNECTGTCYLPRWSDCNKRQLGTLLLHKAFHIHVQEGERQIRKSDF